MPAAGCCPRSTTSSVCTPVAAWPLPAPATPPPTRPSACPIPLCTGSSPTVSSRHLGSKGAQGLGVLPTSAALAGGETSVTTEPLLLVADLLYAMGWSVWTGVVVVFFVQIWPEPKRRQLKRWLDAYEATLRNKARAGSGQASGDDQGRCCSCCDRVGSRQTAAMRTRRPRSAAVARSAFAGFCFPPDVIVLAVRWYLRFALSYRDVEELLAERGVEVDHVTIYRWVQRFTPLLAEAARPCRHAVGDCWQVDETYVKVAGRWRYVYRAIDQFGQVIDVCMAGRRDLKAARRFFERAISTTKVTPSEVATDRAPTYPMVLEELLPAPWHRTDRYANNRMEADHGRLKARLRPMRGLKQDHSARVVLAGHAFVQNLRRGHYELAIDEPVSLRLAVAFEELAVA